MAWGALLAITLATVHPSTRWRNRAAAAVGAAGGLLLAAGLALRLAHRHPTGDALLFGAISMLSAVLIDAAICRPRPLLAPLRSRFLRFFGDISYWIYLIHRVFLNAADRYLRLRHPGFVAHGALSFWLVLTLAASCQLSLRACSCAATWSSLCCRGRAALPRAFLPQP